MQTDKLGKMAVSWVAEGRLKNKHTKGDKETRDIYLDKKKWTESKGVQIPMT